MSCCFDSDYYTMTVGETDKLDFTAVSSNANDAFIITEASYRLIDKNDIVAVEGKCEIDERNLSLILSPTKAGTYKLIITWTAPPETKKKILTIVVRGE